MTGNALFGGTMSGAAPGAKLVSLRACLFIAGCTTHALTEGMIYVAKQGNVDVINMSIGGLPALNDGNNARCELYRRLIAHHNVQMFFSIGNSGPGTNTAGDPGLCTDVIGMGASITKASYQSNYGIVKKWQQSLL
jgi:subtilisin family serine protease